jgi:hypothetical protein
MSVETAPIPTPATPAQPVVAAVPATAPNPAPPAPVAPPAPPMPQSVTIPLEQLQAFTSVQARLAQMELEQRTRDDKATADRVTLMAQKGQVEEAMRTQREEAQRQLDAERATHAATTDRAKRYALDGEVSRVLASQPLVPGGAEQLTKLWRGEFVVEPRGETYVVQTPTFQTVGDFVTAQLAKPEYAHFIRASNPSGGTAGGTGGGSLAAPTAPAHPASPPMPKTFGEAIILQMAENQKGRSSDNRIDPAQAMGLNVRSIQPTRQQA